MWFFLSLIAIVCWGGSDLFSKISSPPEDRYSHWKIVMAVGTVMGIHATGSVLNGATFYPKDFVAYFPAIFCYIASMVLGYVGLRYIMLSVSSPICNSSGAVACLLCLLFLGDRPDWLTWIGIALVCVGVVGLAALEQQTDAQMLSGTQQQKYRNGFIAVFFPIFYCILDGLGTFADAILLDSGKLNEESANIAYEYTFFFLAICAFVYVVFIKKQRLSARASLPKIAGALCETAGQFAYIYAIGSRPVTAAPMISSYCVFSVLLSRIFLKEKLSGKHSMVVGLVLAGIICMGIAEGIATA